MVPSDLLFPSLFSILQQPCAIVTPFFRLFLLIVFKQQQNTIKQKQQMKKEE
jgi:hypothetical protein